MSLYRAYFVPGGLDPEGQDLTGGGLGIDQAIKTNGEKQLNTLLNLMNKKCDSCCPTCKEDKCDVVSPDCCAAMCKTDAAKIVKHILCTWNLPWGPNHTIDSVGGYLCWDWARAFLEAANIEQTKCWGKHLRGIMKPSAMEGGNRPVHFFLELNACNDDSPECSIAVEDGWARGDWPGGVLVHEMPWPATPPWELTDWRPREDGNKHAYTRPAIKPC